MNNNPLHEYMGAKSTMNNPVDSVLSMLNKGMNPESVFNQMLQSNPQAGQLINQIKSQSGGCSPRDLAFQFAKQRGISEQNLMSLLSRFGLK